MKRFYYSIGIIIFLILSCDKPTEFPLEQDVIFKVAPNFSNLKSSCDQPIAQYALIDIDGTIYQTDVFYLNGNIYTNSFKFKSGEHTLNMFVLVNDANTPLDPGDDIIVMAAPKVGYEYANFVSQPLPYNFTVNDFFKTEVSIELLCFHPNDYEYFGFAWYSIKEVNIREVCFSGCLCVDDIESYIGTLYENQSSGLQYKMPAIFKVDIYRNENLIITYDNEDVLGENGPLCVRYPDYEGVVDNFRFVISILGKDGYIEYASYTTTDNVPLIDLDENNVLNFAFGNCENTFSGCETAYAYEANNAYCFTEIEEITSTNWGWSNGTYSPSENNYTLHLYAGAGGCVISSAYLVGNLVLSYNTDGYVVVTYNLNQGYQLGDIHLYVGDKKYQVGNETAALGQFPYKVESANTNTYTFRLNEIFTGPIYIIAHADVCRI